MSKKDIIVLNNIEKMETKLLIWCNSRKKDKINGKLTIEKIEKLESVSGWEWSIKKTSWEENFKRVKVFVEKNRKFPSPSSNSSEEKKIATWVFAQRKNKKLGILSSERIKCLESLQGWFWEVRDVLDKRWKYNFDCCKKFLYENKRFPIKESKIPEEKRLGLWCSVQRKNKKKGGLSQARNQLLELLQGWKWDILEEEWEENFNCCKMFLNKNNKFPKQHSESPAENRLGQWATDQRKNKKKGILSEDRIQKLESISNWSWNIFDEVWEENFHLLKNFIKENITFPSKYSKLSDKKLGCWVVNQKQNRKKGILPSERIKKLESLPDWKWDTNWENRWLENFNFFKKFVEKNKRFPSQHTISLVEKTNGHWANTQRMRNRKGSLPLDQTKLLESIPCWTWEGKFQYA